MVGSVSKIMDSKTLNTREFLVEVVNMQLSEDPAAGWHMLVVRPFGKSKPRMHNWEMKPLKEDLIAQR